MELSNSIKKRFIKDYKLPFQVTQEPMFSYYIKTLDPYFGTVAKLKLLTDVIETLGTEEDFFSESNKVKSTLINDIQLKDTYKLLQMDKLEAYDTATGVASRDIYTMENVNKTFISLDLKHANFNVFSMFSKELTLGFNTYAEMVGSVTEFDYFKQSKYLRQVIFGNMLPKKQQKLQKFVMSKLITMLHEDVGIAMDDFVSASADEVVFAVAKQDLKEFVDMIERKMTNNLVTKEYASWVRVEAFDLLAIGDKKFFVKENCLDGAVDFKGIPSFLFMQVYKKYIGEDLEPLDKTFFHEGYLASFTDSVFDD